ncbi:unnamed protein product [Ostreobium quekettii]|uniref:Guanine nucleotide-binding protein subunit beta-like protein n=1 Tax=Ostreobium quekettii TaxID=121088 RepID=A0A8S1IS50_9CHLO|nr:unnamed protein product [Ostreobium quekettii]|eukprot:evm.model.scf_409.7 EVM.evm.TU.scf_409.7   scf_409:66909-77745(-)
MKLSIEVEIQPEEVALATELFKLLRSLAQEVGASAPAVKDPGAVLRGLIEKLVDPSRLDQVAADVTTILHDTSVGSQESRFDELEKAFLEVTFNQEYVCRSQSVLPFLQLIPKLMDPYRTKLRDKLISTVMQVLVINRPVDAKREEFFLYAEAFAGLVQMEYISISGAAQTIDRLLQKPENRAASLTVLGKTSELCSKQMLEKCDKKALESLRTTVQGIKEEPFHFDVNYISKCMGWTHPLLVQSPLAPGKHSALGNEPASTTATGTSSSASAVSLVPVSSWEGHSDQIFAMCFDPTSRSLITGGKEGTCLVWSEEGAITQRIPMPEHFVCALDMYSQQHMLLAVGMASDEGKKEPPCIALFDQEKGWRRCGYINRTGNALVSCIRAVHGPGSNGFATGEEVGSGAPMEERVCYYDLATATNLSTLEPLAFMSGHEDMVASVVSSTTHPYVLFSGSRDQTVRVWDRRTAAAPTMLGTYDAASGKAVAHSRMVTWLDVSNMDLVSSGGDGCVAHWDLRKLSSSAAGSPPIQRIKLGGQLVLKVALNYAPRPGLVAAASMDALHLIDLRSGAEIAPGPGTANGRLRSTRYFDLKWSEGRNRLYASSEMKIDVFRLQ